MNLTDKAEALALDGPDQLLRRTTVADRRTRGIDAARHRRQGDDLAGPDRIKQLALADDAIAMLEQKDKQIEHLRLDLDALGAVLELNHIRIYLVIAKPIDQSTPSTFPASTW
jgi:hypothetical protein